MTDMTNNAYCDRLADAEEIAWDNLCRLEEYDRTYGSGDVWNPEVVFARTVWNDLYKDCQDNGLDV